MWWSGVHTEKEERRGSVGDMEAIYLVTVPECESINLGNYRVTEEKSAEQSCPLQPM